MSENKPEIPEILDRCLSLIQTGQTEVEDCLANYPDHVEVIQPLVSVAMAARKTLSPPQPSPEVIAITKTRVLNVLRVKIQKARPKRTRRLRSRSLKFRPALALVSLLLTIGLLASGVGAAYASADALPGDSLYGFKRGLEEARLVLTFGVSQEIGLLLQFSDERMEEVEKLTILDRVEDVTLALTGYELMVTRILGISEDPSKQMDEDTFENVLESLENHIEVLDRVRDQVPVSAQSAIDHAKDRSNHGKEVIEDKKEGGSPSDLAPGQLKKDEEETPKDNKGNKDEKGKSPKSK